MIESRQEIVYFLFGKFKNFNLTHWQNTAPSNCGVVLFRDEAFRQEMDSLDNLEMGAFCKSEALELAEEAKEYGSAIRVTYKFTSNESNYNNGLLAFSRIYAFISQIVLLESVKIAWDIRTNRFFTDDQFWKILEGDYGVKSSGPFEGSSLERVLQSKIASEPRTIANHIWVALIRGKDDPSLVHIMTKGLIAFGVPELSMRGVPVAEVSRLGKLLNPLASQLVSLGRPIREEEELGTSEAGKFKARLKGSYEDFEFWNNRHFELERD